MYRYTESNECKITVKVAAMMRKHGARRIESRVKGQRPKSGASDFTGERRLLAGLSRWMDGCFRPVAAFRPFQQLSFGHSMSGHSAIGISLIQGMQRTPYRRQLEHRST